MKLQSIRGMNDIAPPESHIWGKIEDAARAVCRAAGYGEIRTPILEPTELFKRGVGEATDIVEKEMYTFDDRNGDSLTLRPEGTAGVVRAVNQHGWAIQQSILKLFYLGPMYRHERPQKGRYRQFYQFGIELLGVQDPLADAEVISVGWDLLKKIGIHDVELRISTLGTDSCRKPYFKKLTALLKENMDLVPEDFKSRIEKNPQRIFDHKDEKAQALAKKLPLLLDELDEESSQHFKRVQEHLHSMEIPFVVDANIVRGLDYYCHTAFEFTTNSLGKTQNALGGGGRYDGLVEMLGGRPTPGVGFAMGLDRLALVLQEASSFGGVRPDLVIVSSGKESVSVSLKVARELRGRGISVEVDLEGRSMKAQLKRANKLNAQYVLLIGEDECASGMAILKNMETRSEDSIPLEKLTAQLLEKFVESFHQE